MYWGEGESQIERGRKEEGENKRRERGGGGRMREKEGDKKENDGKLFYKVVGISE